MSGFLRVLRRFLGQPDKALSRATTGAQPNLARFAEGDRVLIDRKRLSGPLTHNQKIDTPHGFIPHNDIIGSSIRRRQVKSHTGHAFEVAYPTLDEYVSLAPRKVTPVYASYASLIVSLLDIHVAPPAPTAVPSNPGPSLEILESGTGHGSLTLHLARAVAAANPPAPSLPPPGPKADLDDTWIAWRKSRRAIIHTVELSPTYSAHAEKLIRSFKQGIYAPHIDFYSSDVSEWVSSQLPSRSDEEVENGWLDHVVLDMPGVYRQIPKVVQAMKDEALLAIFVPSVTQIGDCVRVIEESGLPLVMEKVVELGEGISNGRIWDVRLVKTRNAESGPTKESEKNLDSPDRTELAADGTEEQIEKSDTAESDSVFICRPKVGRMTIGGGFVGLWRKADPVAAQTENIRIGRPQRNLRRSASKERRGSGEKIAGK